MGISEKGGRSNTIPEPASKDNLVNLFYLKPMVGNELLDKSEYKVEIVKWIDGSTKDNGIDKMVLRPIEAGNMVELRNGDQVQLMIASGAFGGVKVLRETKKSIMRKKRGFADRTSILWSPATKTTTKCVFYLVEYRG